MNYVKFGKQNKKSFPKSAWSLSKATTNSYWCGRTSKNTNTPSLQGTLHFALFIDDFYKVCWIFFLKCKHEVADVFMKFKWRMETQSVSKIQFLRSDNGKECILKQFNIFCKEADIEHELTAPALQRVGMQNLEAVRHLKAHSF